MHVCVSAAGCVGLFCFCFCSGSFSQITRNCLIGSAQEVSTMIQLSCHFSCYISAPLVCHTPWCSWETVWYHINSSSSLLITSLYKADSVTHDNIVCNFVCHNTETKTVGQAETSSHVIFNFLWQCVLRVTVTLWLSHTPSQLNLVVHVRDFLGKTKPTVIKYLINFM